MKNVLITGASTGLGLATARAFIAAGGYRLLLTARERSMSRFADEGLRETDQVFLREMDVTSAEQRQSVTSEVEERWGGVDILVNNAGIAIRSVVEHVTDEERRTQMDINFLAPMELVRLVLPSMREKRSGRIINISSVGGMMAMPTMAVYSASKFALEGATEALFYEVRPWNIHVSLVQPDSSALLPSRT
jgi:short-subunit dehydrogenase